MSGSDAAATILVVEDDRVVADTLRLYLEHAGFRVLLAGDGRHGLEMALRQDPALVLLDVLLPGLDGREVCRRLRAVSAVPIIMLTARTAEDDVVATLELGADEHIGKPFRPREVVARVRALLRRQPGAGAVPPDPLRVGELEIDGWGRCARVAGREVALTRSELVLLETLARYPGRVFTRDELAQALGPERDTGERTIDSHVTHLRRKIDGERGPSHIVTVHGVGYRLRTGADVA